MPAQELIVTRSTEALLTPEITFQAPFAVMTACGSCGRRAKPKLDRWRFGPDWAEDWATVFAMRVFRSRCGGAASGLLVTADGPDSTETMLKLEKPSGGSYARVSDDNRTGICIV